MTSAPMASASATWMGTRISVRRKVFCIAGQNRQSRAIIWKLPRPNSPFLVKASTATPPNGTRKKPTRNKVAGASST